MLSLENISCEQNDRKLIDGVSAMIEPPDFVAIVGPNGAGKSTLLRAAIGLAPLSTGNVTFDGQPLLALSPTERARKIAYLPQHREAVWSMNVEDVVTLGRYAFGAQTAPRNDEAVNDAMEMCDVTPFKNRPCTSLSGGELARVHLARTLASSASMFLLDEPLAALDGKYQYRVLSHLRKLSLSGRPVITVLHDLSLAWRFATKVLLLNNGIKLGWGTPAEVLTPSSIEAAFSLKSSVLSVHGEDQLVIDGEA